VSNSRAARAFSMLAMPHFSTGMPWGDCPAAAKVEKHLEEI
jgi:hypothetical protein